MRPLKAAVWVKRAQSEGVATWQPSLQIGLYGFARAAGVLSRATTTAHRGARSGSQSSRRLKSADSALALKSVRKSARATRENRNVLKSRRIVRRVLVLQPVHRKA